MDIDTYIDTYQKCADWWMPIDIRKDDLIPLTKSPPALECNVAMLRFHVPLQNNAECSWPTSN